MMLGPALIVESDLEQQRVLVREADDLHADGHAVLRARACGHGEHGEVRVVPHAEEPRVGGHVERMAVGLGVLAIEAADLGGRARLDHGVQPVLGEERAPGRHELRALGLGEHVVERAAHARGHGVEVLRELAAMEVLAAGELRVDRERLGRQHRLPPRSRSAVLLERVVGALVGHELRTEARELFLEAGEDGGDPRREQPVGEAGHADPRPAERTRARARLERIGRSRRLDERHAIARVDAREDAEQDGAVLRAARHRAQHVVAVGDRDAAARADQPETRLERRDAVDVGGDADAAPSVGAERDRDGASGDRDRAAAARAAGREPPVPGVDAPGSAGELAAVQVAEQDHAPRPRAASRPPSRRWPRCPSATGCRPPAGGRPRRPRPSARPGCRSGRRHRRAAAGRPRRARRPARCPRRR